MTVAPEIDEDTRAWWAALAEGRLEIPACNSCAHRFFPPLPQCPACGSRELGAVDSSGLGRVYSWIVVHQAADPAFAGETPYTVVAVTLDEGVRLFGRIAAGPVAPDLRVRAVTYEVAGTTLLGFERC
jgi:uncharacterized OB-fold protein